MEITVITSFSGEKARFSDIEIRNLDLKNKNEVKEVIKSIENVVRIYNSINTPVDSEKNETAPEKLLTRIETAKLLGVTLPTVIGWSKKGILKGYRIGNRVRYKETEIMETITNNKII